MTKRTSELLARLKKMAAQAGENLFERATLALEVLADLQWIAETYGGDQGKAEETIAAECFSDVSMTGWFGKLLVLRKYFKEIEQWRQYKFDLQRLWIAYTERPSEEGGKKPPVVSSQRNNPVPWKKHEEVKDELHSAQYQLRREKEKVTDWQERCQDLEHEKRDLERELAEAQGRIVTLEALLERCMPSAAVACANA